MSSIIIEGFPRRSQRTFEQTSGIEHLRYAIARGINSRNIELSRNDDIDNIDVEKLRTLALDFLIVKHDIGNIGVKKRWVYALSNRDLAKRINYDLSDSLEDELSPRLHIPDDSDIPTRADELRELSRIRRATKKNKKKIKKKREGRVFKSKRQPKRLAKRQPKRLAKRLAKRQSKRQKNKSKVVHLKK
jgi:hypothetical protein